MSNLLSKIKSPADLKQLKPAELKLLVDELRERIIHEVAAKEGHLGASLGVVELTVALHYLFDTPDDLLIWDVGHQAYGHKILTGRQDLFHSNRQLGGISGFPKMEESEYDAFGVGHSSTSISAALGMAIASKLKGEQRHHIAVIGRNRGGIFRIHVVLGVHSSRCDDSDDDALRLECYRIGFHCHIQTRLAGAISHRDRDLDIGY